jgi:2,4-dienoyl-CoA reductase-like NADH-dependent reductase (Old Yellow Enzyme family)
MRGSPVVGTGPVGYGYQVPYAAKVKSEADIMAMAVGLIVHADQAEQILQNGEADLIALAREFLHNPNWTLDAAQKLGLDDANDLMPSAYKFWLEKRESAVQELVTSTQQSGIGGA